MKKKLLSFILIFVFVLGFFVVADAAFALDTGVNEVNNTIDLGNTDPRVVIARIIQIALGFLGTIAVVLVIYAGFIWMTSEGQEEKVSKAKRTLSSAVVGLIIVLSAFGITTFLLNRLMEATGVQSNSSSTSYDNPNLGLGSLGACTIETVYPEPGQVDVARNTSILINVKEELNLETVCEDTSGDGLFCNCSGSVCDSIIPENIRIFTSDAGDACETDCSGNEIDVSAVVSLDGLSFALIPTDYLGSSAQKTWYTVYLSNDIEKVEEGNLFDSCSADFMQWSFEVGTFLDLTPPQVKQGGVFPSPDDDEDEMQEVSVYQAATGKISVLATPDTYEVAYVDFVTKDPIAGGWDTASAVIDPNYHQQLSSFQVVVINSGDQAQLFNGNDLLGVASFSNNAVVFDNYFILTVNGTNYNEGSAWIVGVQPEIIADSLVVGNETYIFSDNFNANNIPVDANNSVQANYINIKLSGHPDVDILFVANEVDLTAKIAGSQGNDIVLTSSSVGLSIVPMAGGVTGQTSFIVNDGRDQPRNTVIQINFNEPVNPIMISGDAQNVYDYIRVINNATGALVNGDACMDNTECLSYNCQSNICEGNSLTGKFMVSNMFRTVEFISDDECGVNGCGETIYCLPGSSELAVEMEAANLKECTSDNDCVNLTPYNSCIDSGLGYSVCQSDETVNYPLSNPAAMDGIMDAAINSLNGNRDVAADGPLEYFSENLENPILKDSFRWTFYINDTIEISPPSIISVDPDLSDIGVLLNKNIEIEFDKLMMNISLQTGSVIINNGEQDIEHKQINLRASSPYPLGYWVTVENIDLPPLNNEPDISRATLRHSLLGDAMSHIVQVGSGVKDIYQNCFKPSSGPACTANDLQPSCCFGTPVAGADCTGY